jgi:hypothetical protein
MIREIVKLNYDIINYANKRVADYFDFENYEGQSLFTKARFEFGLRKLFVDYMTDLWNTTQRPVVSGSEIDAASDLFRQEYLAFVEKYPHLQRSTFHLPFAEFPSLFLGPLTKTGLREKKILEYYNGLFTDLTDYRFVFSEKPAAKGHAAHTASKTESVVNESAVGDRIKAFSEKLKEIYGVKTTHAS